MSEQDLAPTIGARGVSFESRIAIAALMTAVMVLALACALFVVVQLQGARTDFKHVQSGLTQLLGMQIAPDVERGDHSAVVSALNILQRFPAVQGAEVIDLHGGVVARFTPRGRPPFDFNAPMPKMSLSSVSLQVDGRPLGRFTLAIRPKSLSAILPGYIAICGALFFAATGMALFMGRWLAGRVIEPVNRLSQAMRDVAQSADYAQRVPSWARDEFGLLTDSFNNLLAQLQANDYALQIAMSELVEARDAAEAANVLKSQFLANMSHEIRTPLNGVLAMAQIIDMGELSDVQRGRVGIIRRSGEELLAVLNDVLDLSKIEAGRMEIDQGEVDADLLGRNVHAMFDAVASAKPEVLFSLEVADGASGPRRGDPARLGQILNNLVSNALKFTLRGEVRVRIEAFGENGAEGLRFVVRDTGIGIPADKLPMLFQKFSQADGSNTRRFGGTGLGLAISRELAEMMHGHITVESVEGEGSTFVMTIPAARLAANSAAFAAEVSEPDLENRALRVLAAEDIPTNQLVLRTIMQTFGVELEMVDNGRLALEAWTAGSYDLILMDIQMPEMDGIAATRAIRAAERETGRARTPIIAVSANAMTHQVKEYMAVGMDGHVAKPIELAKLAAAIEHALTDGAAESAVA